jgi:glycosyltransferase involved in cell wall biosynthesis
LNDGKFAQEQGFFVEASIYVGDPGFRIQEGFPVKLPGPDGVQGSSKTHSAQTVAVCIGTYNQAQYLRECIESVVAQTHSIREIWVSDDASTDETPEVMREICKLSTKIHYYRQPQNLGIAGNLSWVLSQPVTDFIVRVDSDDRLEPLYVATLVDLMLKYPQAGYAHCNLYEIDGRGVRTRMRRLHRPAVYEGPEDAIRRNTPGYRVAGNIVLYRSAALKEANYYHANASWQYA